MSLGVSVILIRSVRVYLVLLVAESWKVSSVSSKTAASTTSSNVKVRARVSILRS